MKGTMIDPFVYGEGRLNSFDLKRGVDISAHCPGCKRDEKRCLLLFSRSSKGSFVTIFSPFKGSDAEGVKHTFNLTFIGRFAGNGFFRWFADELDVLPQLLQELVAANAPG